MTGLELCEQYWNEIGKPAFSERSEILDCAAVGLVGEGSECFGYDDEVSRDHDWGPGFCVWLDDENYARCGEAAAAIYRSLPEEYLGFRRQLQTAQTAGRIGVMPIGIFYRRYTGLDRAPETIAEWRRIPENGLSVVTNGKVFCDAAGKFSSIREGLLNYYPEDLRRKKLAKHCALAGQQGQYNYSRCLKHGETVSAFIALGQFIEEAQAIIFLLNRRYKPYYKWSQRALTELPVLGAKVSVLLRRLTEEPDSREDLIEEISALIIMELKFQHLTFSGSDFLLDQAQRVQASIQDDALRSLHLMVE